MKERVFADPPRTIEHLMVKFKAAVMHSRWKHVKMCLREYRGSLLCPLKRTEVVWNNCEAPMVWSFESLCHLAVTYSFKTKCLRTYAIQYFRLLFKQGMTLRRTCVRISFHRLYYRKVAIGNWKGKEFKFWQG
jgi:hypothetical protein